jgi:hypothetical protein
MIKKITVLAMSAATLVLSPSAFAVKGKEVRPSVRVKEAAQEGKAAAERGKAKGLEKPSEAAQRNSSELDTANVRANAEFAQSLKPLESTFKDEVAAVKSLVNDGRMSTEQAEGARSLMEMAQDSLARLRLDNVAALEAQVKRIQDALPKELSEEQQSQAFTEIISGSRQVKGVENARDILLTMAAFGTISVLKSASGESSSSSYLKLLGKVTYSVKTSADQKLALGEFGRVYSDKIKDLIKCKRA